LSEKIALHKEEPDPIGGGRGMLTEKEKRGTPLQAPVIGGGAQDTISVTNGKET